MQLKKMSQNEAIMSSSIQRFQQRKSKKQSLNITSTNLYVGNNDTSQGEEDDESYEIMHEKVTYILDEIAVIFKHNEFDKRTLECYRLLAKNDPTQAKKIIFELIDFVEVQIMCDIENKQKNAEDTLFAKEHPFKTLFKWNDSNSRLKGIALFYAVGDILKFGAKVVCHALNEKMQEAANANGTEHHAVFEQAHDYIENSSKKREEKRSESYQSSLERIEEHRIDIEEFFINLRNVLCDNNTAIDSYNKDLFKKFGSLCELLLK